MVKVALGVQVMSDKIIYATVKLIVKGKVDIEIREVYLILII